jgi:hypothetical protein
VKESDPDGSAREARAECSNALSAHPECRVQIESLVACGERLFTDT